MIIQSLMRLGSPPHTRGKAFVSFSKTPCCRITPAHAGKSIRHHSKILLIEDHPRTRGEKLYIPNSAQGLKGSPPHTRGKVAIGIPIVAAGGITPAHAGKRFEGLLDCLLCEDHPRTRGEKCPLPLLFQRSGGSPPHTRGKGLQLYFRDEWTRITPAHAGKS